MAVDRHDTAIRQRVLRALDNRHLKLTLMPTEQCNFRCTYCYEDFELGTMPRRVVDGVRALMDAHAPQLRRLELRWFGGEPLVAYPIVTELCRHGQGLALEHPGMAFISSMTTNAYLLTPDRFRTLVGLGVTSYQISLDGYGGDHDRTRQRRDGAGTFDRVWSNLLATRELESNFQVIIRCHITPSTLAETYTLIDAINTEFGQDDRYRVFFKAISRLGGPHDDQIGTGAPGWDTEAKRALTARLARRAESVADPVAGGTYMCYAAEPNSLVVRSNGQIAKCTVAFDDPRNQVGQVHANGTLTIDDERMRLWFTGLETLDPATLQCPLPRLGPLPVHAEPVRFITRRASISAPR